METLEDSDCSLVGRWWVSRSVSRLVGRLVSISVVSDWFISPLPWILGPSKNMPATQEEENTYVLNKQTKVDSIL